ncbi:MAG: GtrA family protein [Pseudomonadota bacterium]
MQRVLHSLPPWLRRLLRLRFVKFATVGASGALVNISILYCAHDLLFVAINSPALRLNAALALAILCATGNNFAWNRFWTWRDRPHSMLFRRLPPSLLRQFVQYALACWVGIALQIGLTHFLVLYCHYLLANGMAIVVASLFNFVLNDRWTFRIDRTAHRPSIVPTKEVRK